MDFGDFVGGSIEGTIQVFGIVIASVIFFWVVIKVIEIISNGATKMSGLSPKSEQGEKRSTRIGITLFVLFLIFGLFIAPLLEK
jgi:hypothetical protein